MSPGRIAPSSSGDKPRLAKVPGRYPCEKTSALRTSPRRISASPLARRSSSADSLPCPVSNSWYPRLGRCAPVILKTSAPCSATSRSSQDASQVEDADARERPIAGWKRFGGAVADAHDLHERQRRHRSALRMSRPFCLRSRHAAGALRCNDRLLKIGGVPSGHCARHGLTILRYAEHAECRRAMIGKIAVEIGPAPIAGWIEAHDGVSLG